MYSSLDKIDIVANGKPGALGKVAYQTDHRQEEEYKEQRALSTLLALARVINPNRVDQEDNERHGVIYVAVARPPDWFRLALASAGAALEIGRTPLAWEGDLADPADLADAAFRELAERVRSRAGRALDDDLLKGLEDEILAEAPSKEADEIRYWTAVMELAAVGGELVRARIGGRWVRDDRWYSTVPFVFQQEGTQT